MTDLPMTDRKPDGPWSVLSTESDGEVLVVGENGAWAAAFLETTDFSFEDARRHAEDFAAKLNAEHAAGKDAK